MIGNTQLSDLKSIIIKIFMCQMRTSIFDDQVSNYCVFIEDLLEIADGLYYSISFYGLLSFKIIALVFCVFKQMGRKSWVVIKIQQISSEIYPTLKEIDFTLAKLLLTLNFLQNIFPFCISLLFQVRQIVFVKQYVHRRHADYVGDSQSYLKLRLLRIAFVFLNAISYCFQMPALFKAGFSVLFMIQIWFLIDSKFQITLQKIPDLLICFEVAVHFMTELIIVESFSFQASYSKTSIAKYMLAFVGSFIFFEFCKKYLQERQFEWISKKKVRLEIKLYSLQLTKYIEDCSVTLDAKFLEGSIRSYHQLMGCLNKNCQIQQETDSFFNKYQRIEGSLMCSKEIMLISFVECLYETEIEKSKNTIQQKGFIFDYCQFLLNANHKIPRLLFLIKRLELMKLGLIELQKIAKFKCYLRNHLSRLSASLYVGKINFQRIEIGDKAIQQINVNIDDYLYYNKLIWHSLEEGLINCQEMKECIMTNKLLLDKIDNKWEEINDCLALSQVWRRLHLFYLLLVKNQHQNRLKAQLLQLNNFKSQRENIIDGQSTELSGNLLSHPLTGFISSKFINNELFVTWMSQSFKLQTGYSVQELYLTPLDSIYPQREKTKNREFLKGMLKFDEQSYIPLKSYIFLRSSHQAAVQMFFKPIFSIQQCFTFLTFVKFEKEPAKPIESRSAAQISTVICAKSVEIQDNIFVKDSRILFTSNHSNIVTYFNFARTIALLCAFFLLLTMNLVNKNYSSLMDYSEQFINFMHLYRYPMILNINYMRSFLNIGNQAKVSQTIQLNTQLMQMTATNQKTLKTLFDPALNTYSQYSPNGITPEIINITYNRIDLFFTIVDYIVGINFSNIDLLSSQYKNFAALLKPSYDIMANSTKFNLHNQFRDLLSQSKSLTMVITYVGLIITLIPSLLMFKGIRVYLKKQQTTYETIHSFKKQYYKDIFQYITRIKARFLFLSDPLRANNDVCQTKSKSSIFNQQNAKLQLNARSLSLAKKDKLLCQIFASQIPSNKVFYLLFLTFTALIVLTCITFQAFNHAKISDLQVLQDDGFSFLHYFPAGAILAMGSMEKFYSQNHPSHFTFNNSKYDDAISSVYLFGSIPYKKVFQSDSAYLQKRKNYFFGNLCVYNSSLLEGIGLDTEKCQKISNGSFKQGLSAYLRYSCQFGGGYLKGQFAVTSDQIDEYVISVSILNAYVLDTLASWIEEFKGNCEAQQQFNLYLGYLFAVFIILLQFLLNEIIFQKKRKQNSKLKQHAFQYFIPNDVILQDKLIRHKLEASGLFHRQ